MKKYPLSLIIIALNEEKNIKRCIESVPFASEVIVVDSHSVDQTAPVAQKLGAKVFQKKFEGYRQQKQFAQDQATQEWILSLDADEALSPELQKEIEELFEKILLNSSKADFHNGFKIPRLSFHLGRWIRHGGWYPDFQLRLYKKSKAKWIGGEVHEKIEINGNVGTLKNNLLHYVFENLTDQIYTNNRYSTQGALELKNKKKSFSFLKLIFKPFGKFLECYFFKLGLLDGSAGFIIALSAAQSMFLKYAKLWEMENFPEKVN